MSRSKRLRKKLYLDEFAIFGFEFECHLSCTSEDEFDTFMIEMIDFFESRNLNVGGGGSVESFGGFVCSNERYGSATEEDIEETQAWLSTHRMVTGVNVGQLVDAMYGM